VEKRYQRRLKVRVRIVLRDRHGRRGRFEIRNATPDGMFIETGRVGIATGEVIWIDAVEAGRGRWRGPIPAVVVHRAGDGIGVLLSRPVPDWLTRVDDGAPDAGGGFVPDAGRRPSW
jgi:hypothetical protein